MRDVFVPKALGVERWFRTVDPEGAIGQWHIWARAPEEGRAAGPARCGYRPADIPMRRLETAVEVSTDKRGVCAACVSVVWQSRGGCRCDDPSSPYCLVHLGWDY